MSWLFLGALALLQPGAEPRPTDDHMAADPVAHGEIVEALPEGVATDILELTPDAYRRMTVPVTIMGTGPYRFLIDTGAQATVLSNTLADRLQLIDRRAATLVGMSSARQVEVTRVPDFALGSRVLAIRQAPLVAPDNIGGADGILGLDSLQDQRVLLDFANREVHVADAATLGGDRGYDIVVRARRELGQLIIARAQLNGIAVSVIVDTGAQGSIGNAALLARLRRAANHGDAQMTDINGVTRTGTMRNARKLVLGRAELANFPITFAPSPTFAALGLADRPAMVLGMNELRAFDRVAIDFATRRILFDMPASVTRQIDPFIGRPRTMR